MKPIFKINVLLITVVFLVKYDALFIRAIDWCGTYYRNVVTILNKDLSSGDNSKLENIRGSVSAVILEETALKESYKVYFILGLFLLSISLIFYYKYKIKSFDNLIKHIFILQNNGKNNCKKRNLIEKTVMESNLRESAYSLKSTDIKMSIDTEKRILEKMEEFENQLLYLDPHISILSLATFCETNIRYVSMILKNKKEQDFCSYINMLRIYYIVQKIEEVKEYRSYKISYLAKISGFSSHSKFSSMFKQVIGLSPSEFIGLHNSFGLVTLTKE